MGVWFGVVSLWDKFDMNGGQHDLKTMLGAVWVLDSGIFRVQGLSVRALDGGFIASKGGRNSPNPKTLYSNPINSTLDSTPYTQTPLSLKP